MKPIIIIDTREQLPFEFSNTVDVQSAPLDAGDYSVAGMTASVAIERKSLSDFVGSITAGRERFWNCCDRMSRLDFACIVVECSMDDVLTSNYRSKARPQSVIGSALAIHVDFGIPVIWAGNRTNAANITERLLTRLWRKHLTEAGQVAC